jgi:hypothetical protein
MNPRYIDATPGDSALPLKLVRGTASDEELAAVLVVLLQARSAVDAHADVPSDRAEYVDDAWARTFRPAGPWSSGMRVWGS